MIDLQTETVVRLADATAYLPKHPSGKRPHVACLYRWQAKGVNGVRLEVLDVGGVMCTSVEALQRFCDACTAARLGTAAPATTSRQRKRRIEQAEREAVASGI